MSEISSPASSLDFFESDGSADSDYDEALRRTRKQPPKKPGARRGTSTPTASGSEFGTKIRINLSSLQRRAVEGGAAIEQEEEGDEDEEGYFDGLIGKRGVDLSGQTLKGDHALRPLWVDDRGNMWVLWPPTQPGHWLTMSGSIVEAFAPFAKQAQDFLVAISEPVSR